MFEGKLRVFVMKREFSVTLQDSCMRRETKSKFQMRCWYQEIKCNLHMIESIQCKLRKGKGKRKTILQTPRIEEMRPNQSELTPPNDVIPYSASTGQK